MDKDFETSFMILKCSVLKEKTFNDAIIDRLTLPDN